MYLKISNSPSSASVSPTVKWPVYHSAAHKQQFVLPNLNELGDDDGKSAAYFDKFREKKKINKKLRDELLQELEPVDLPQGTGKKILINKSVTILRMIL